MFGYGSEVLMFLLRNLLGNSRFTVKDTFRTSPASSGFVVLFRGIGSMDFSTKCLHDVLVLVAVSVPSIFVTFFVKRVLDGFRPY